MMMISHWICLHTINNSKFMYCVCMGLYIDDEYVTGISHMSVKCVMNTVMVSIDKKWVNVDFIWL